MEDITIHIMDDGGIRIIDGKMRLMKLVSGGYNKIPVHTTQGLYGYLEEIDNLWYFVLDLHRTNRRKSGPNE